MGDRLYIFKIKIRMLLFVYGLLLVRAWFRDVWMKDAYSKICCDGYMCGCYGAWNCEMWESMLNRKKNQ